MPFSCQCLGGKEMNDEQISRTAQMTAFSRGYHSSNDSPVIFEDHLAFELLGTFGIIEEQCWRSLLSIPQQLRRSR
jgi:O-methyltransferase involved in polyketide biosynthesis